MPEVIVDANVLVSGTGNTTGSAPGRVVHGLILGRFPTLVSSQLLAEYRRVFYRPRIQRVHRLGLDELDDYLQTIKDQARTVSPRPSGVPCPDPGDQHLWDLLAAEPDAILVTGDRKLLESGDFPGRVLSPREFVERFGL